MSDSFVQVAPDSTGKLIDNDQLTVGLNVVQRQRIINASPSNAAGLAEVVNAAPTTQYGLVVWTSQLPALVGGRLPVDGSGVTQPVSIAAAVTVAGTVAVSNFPGTQPVSGTVAVSNFPGTQPVSVAAAVTVQQATAASLNATAVLAAGSADAGNIGFAPRTALALTRASVSVNGSGDNTLIAAPTGGPKIYVHRLLLVFASAVNAQLFDGTAGTALTGLMSFTGSGSLVLDFTGEPWFATSSTNNNFVLNLSSGVQVSGAIWYKTA